MKKVNSEEKGSWYLISDVSKVGITIRTSHSMFFAQGIRRNVHFEYNSQDFCYTCLLE